MPAHPIRLAALAGALVGCLTIGLAPVPAGAATDCDHDWLPEPPSNDNRASSTKYLNGALFSTNGINCWATKEAGEPAHAGQAAAKSVWIDFKTLQGYTARIDIYTAGSDFDPRLAVYEADSGALAGQNDDVSSANRTSKVSFLRAPTGSTTRINYKVAIDGYTDGSGDTADGRYIIGWKQPLVAFTSTTHLTRSIADVYLGRTPTSAEYSQTVTDYQDGHNHQPGWIASDLAGPGIEAAMPVARLYTAVFNRLPDPSGLAYWIKKRKAGATLNTIAANMTASNEFKNTYGNLNNGQFVDLVYQNVLKRSPDPSGRAYWVKKLDGGFKRSAMMAQFSESNEYVTKSQDITAAAIIWRLGHGSKTDAQLRSMVQTYWYTVDWFGFLLEDASFQAYVAGR